MALSQKQRKSLTPVQYPRTSRQIQIRTPSSFDAGLEVPLTFAHVMREEEWSAQLGLAVKMAEMPKVLLNTVSLRVRAFFVPMTAFERFPSLQSFNASWAGEPERDGMAIVPVVTTGVLGDTSEIAISSGLQWNATDTINIDFVEAYNQVINHERSQINAILFAENERLLNDTTIARATYIRHLFGDVKPTFDEASVDGLVPIDLEDSLLPVQGIGVNPDSAFYNPADGRSFKDTISSRTARTTDHHVDTSASPVIEMSATDDPLVFAQLNAGVAAISLGKLDQARMIAAYAKLRDQYAGHEEVRYIDALMSGLTIPYEAMQHPILLNETVTQFNTVERNATDGPNLDVSVTEGVATANLTIRVPRTPCGGYIVVTATAQPDQIFERRRDPMLYTTSVEQWPDAFNDTLDIHKVEVVTCGEVDNSHTTPNATYGYAPKNMRFARPVDRVGGKFRDLPANAENRAALWLIDFTDPVYGQSHHLCPKPFPKDVFADTLAPAFETRTVVAGNAVGLTQFGPQVLEDEGSYVALVDAIRAEDAE